MSEDTGFCGGSSIFALGTDSDMKLFFDCISYYLLPKYPKEDWSILTDRLYRRYLKLEELDTAESLMKLVEEEFKQLDRDAIDWGPILSGKAKSDLDRTKSTLYDIFDDYFYAFHQCVESAKMNHEWFKSEPDYKYEPVMVCMAQVPYVVDYRYIPLSVFDNLGADEKPIWWTGKIPK
ncbi:hypothetical protein A9G28_03560 [Gilliamella sp. Fer1-1]|uniref:hypothetical protein n=1 Tax=Gilliamella sp. Fer1-1 TaxID=3120240 RepID=UPI00080E912B|nr:hypothetical protein [Gilliamella apicola]OCG43897.1 hypothetical protein A9G28_03560 [Gilliamella apicola]